MLRFLAEFLEQLLRFFGFRRVCVVPGDAERMLVAAMSQLGLSARGHDRVLKVARTIADLEGADSITAEHCAEALQYRGLDRRWRP